MWRFDLELLPPQSLRKIELRKKEEVSLSRRQRRIAQHGNRKDNFTITILAIQPTELRCRSITIDTFRCLIPVKRSMRDCAERTNNILHSMKNTLYHFYIKKIIIEFHIGSYISA